jgi:ATP-dependent Clp protease adaptor protein ClpS
MTAQTTTTATAIKNAIGLPTMFETRRAKWAKRSCTGCAEFDEISTFGREDLLAIRITRRQGPEPTALAANCSTWLDAHAARWATRPAGAQLPGGARLKCRMATFWDNLSGQQACPQFAAVRNPARRGRRRLRARRSVDARTNDLARNRLDDYYLLHSTPPLSGAIHGWDSESGAQPLRLRAVEVEPLTSTDMQSAPTRHVDLRPRLADDDRKRRGDTGAPGTAIITKTKPQTKRPNLYRVLILNDDYTPMEFVVHVLERFFNKDRETATRIMLHVHHHGIGECGVFTYEVAETKVTQVMDFARKHQHPLQCVMEKK